ncbi:MAG: hypothetical protein IPM59_12160 [Chloracidobacterium sp.]|nr:hypothetical protein [Chloracidobacterium sp.]
MSEVVLTLPDELAAEAKEMGLFKPLLASSLFKAEIRRRKANRLFEAADRLAEAGEPMTEEEVMAEIKAVREWRPHRL